MFLLFNNPTYNWLEYIDKLIEFTHRFTMFIGQFRSFLKKNLNRLFKINEVIRKGHKNVLRKYEYFGGK